MREITRRDTEDRSLEGINAQLRVRYQRECYFHGVMICYDTTDSWSFTQAVSIYKTLIADTSNEDKISFYAKIPVAFVGTKLDLTTFLKSDGSGVPRSVEPAEVRPWLAKVHRRAENACFESSAFKNVGVSGVVDWIVRSALRVYPEVELSKPHKVLRFKSGKEAIPMSDKMKVMLAKAGHFNEDEVDEKVVAAAN